MTEIVERTMLKVRRKALCLGALCSASLVMPLEQMNAQDAAITPESVEVALRKSADWILDNPTGRDTRHWVIAPLYDGLLRTAESIDESEYLETVLGLGIQSGWLPGPRMYHADDHAVGHAWLDIYFMDTSRKERLIPFIDRFGEIFANPRLEDLDYRRKEEFEGVNISDRWTWCDALYMAPPTLARLYKATEDERYLEFLEREYRFTYDRLYDAEEKLFYRDSRFFDRKTKHGEKVFWSRGNGWVYGGLALTLEELPEDYPYRDFLESLYLEMTDGIMQSMQEDGLWRPSLRDPNEIPVGETSGSGFFVFGLAWGVNNGLLDREEYEPIIEKGWNGLLTRIGDDGKVGYVQRIGSAPDTLVPEDTLDYGVGAFLLAGAEVYRMVVDAEIDTDMSKMLQVAESSMEAAAAEPIAYARLVPERKGDLAWENDKVAFRVYGPALRDSAEDSGVDAWCKSVDYPIINKWYDLDLSGVQSYHEDHGEGFDGYKVGSARGCGGHGIWTEEGLVSANVYQSAAINWSSDKIAKFTLEYKYPTSEYGNVIETKVVELALGERFYTVSSTFKNAETREPIEGMEIAIGLTPQSEDPKVRKNKKSGILSITDDFHGESLSTAVVANPESRNGVFFADQGKAGEQYLVVKTDKEGAVSYRAGFTWTGSKNAPKQKNWVAKALTSGK